MAYLDTLFQLGMDLTRSSTAQKEDIGEAAHVAHRSGCVHRTHDDRKEIFTERNGVRFAGQHLIIDLFDARRLDDLEHIERTLKRCAEVAGATLLHVHLHQATPNGGVSGVAVLSESHITIHSWPEAGYAAVDVFMCGAAEPERTIQVLKAAFAAEDVVVKEHRRGNAPAASRWQVAAVSKKPPTRMRKAKAA